MSPPIPLKINPLFYEKALGMEELGLTSLATLDKDFDRVEGLGVYKPTDV